MDQFRLGPEDLPLTGVTPRDRDRLTFGVEFEFVLATLKAGNEDPTPEDGRVVVGIDSAEKNSNSDSARENAAIRHVAEILAAAGVNSEPVVDHDESYKPADPEAWLVKTDISIDSPEDPEADMYTWFAIEITTPPYYFSSRALDKVKQVCEILTSTYRLNCNRTAGVHVHVGNNKQGFSFDTLKNLFAILWTFEPQICDIHPYHRTEDNLYCSNMRTNSYLALQQVGPGEPAYIAERGLEIILNYRTMKELGEGVGGHEYGAMAYNMDNVLAILTGATVDTTKNTIEFRQHESTLDPERATNWARFCVGCLEFADTVPREALEKFLKKHILDSPTDFTIGQVLTALGMPYLAPFYTQKVAEQRIKDEAMKKAEDDAYAALGPFEAARQKASSKSSRSQDLARKKWSSGSRSKPSSNSSSWD